jgi:hypothetical protein
MMGIDTNGLRFLLYAKSFGVDYSKTAMIGRQGLYLSFDQFCKVMRSEFNYDLDLEMLEAIYNKKYVDELLKYLDANEVHSFDYSDYEGATYTHDFNEVIPEEYFGQYTAIIEGGTLEHVFNFPVAIKNCMQMLKVGGHYLGITPTNNYMGHGFYQFSPELYFRIFCPENGFRVENIILHERGTTTKWFSVADPDHVKRRVGLMCATPMLLLILAVRLANCPIFSTPPLQSDYVSIWNGLDSKAHLSVEKDIQSILKRWIPKSVRNWIPESVRSCIKIVFGWSYNLAFFKSFSPFETKTVSNHTNNEII